MNWSDHFPELKRQQLTPPEPRSGPAIMQSLSEIPPEAEPHHVFRLPVEVMQVDERETRTGNSCYFLNVRDAKGVRFSIVCWESQWAKLRGKLVAGEQATLDVKVPVGGFNSFTLADR